MTGALTAEELLAQSEIAGPAEVISVAWGTGPGPHVAKLRFQTFMKGSPRSRSRFMAALPWRNVVKVKMRRIARDAEGNPLPGEWSDRYRAGDRVMTHLIWDAEQKSYVTLCWNAVWQIPG